MLLWKHPHSDGTTTLTEMKGDVRFFGVDFGYNEDKQILYDVSLFAKPGQKIAFVGSTGAGKTTITNLINRFYDVQDGKIRVDGININKIKKADLRRSQSVVLQDTHLFTDTVLENIRYGRLDATDEECIKAAKLANADYFISHLPEGYNTMLVSDGSNLSQGQRQLIAIARAAVADPAILILDEATSSIDTRTEMLIEKGIQYVGVNDREIDLFEGQYIVPDGMAYNSYVIIDEKIAVFDTVDGGFKEQWLEKLQTALQGRTPDYLIVQHMEPDHSANILAFVEKYPTAKIVASSKAFIMMKNYFGKDFAEKRIVVGNGDTLALGENADAHKLIFYEAPMVHWPEVIVTYDEKTKTLFSADAFGKFGALGDDVTAIDEDWACEARRYYVGIVAKYGVQVQNLLKKLSACEIQMICPFPLQAAT